MNCQRCLTVKAQYRVYSDIMNLKVCASCAISALELGILVEALSVSTTRPPVSQHSEEGQDFPVMGEDPSH